MNANIPSVTLSEAKTIIKALAHEQSVPLLSPPGAGKSGAVHQTAADALIFGSVSPEDTAMFSVF